MKNLTITNYNTYEYSSQKLLFNSDKCNNIFDILNKKNVFDPSLPISMEIHLTNKCNLKCDWCVDHIVRSNNESLPYDSLIKFIDEIKEYKIGLTIEGGGEPTLYPHFNDFIMTAYNKGINLGMITNGTKCLTPEIVNCFQWIRISLDASYPEEYYIEKGMDCFDKVINNIKNICQYKNDTIVGASYILNNRNYKNIPAFLNTLQDLGLDYVQMRPVEENPHLTLTKENMDELINDIENKFDKKGLYIRLNSSLEDRTNNKNLPCIAHSLRSIIHADGEVFLCEKRRHDIITLGNIKNESFLNIWNSNKRKEASIKLLDAKNQIGCTECRITNYNQLFIDLMNVKTKHFI